MEHKLKILFGIFLFAMLAVVNVGLSQQSETMKNVVTKPITVNTVVVIEDGHKQVYKWIGDKYPEELNEIVSKHNLAEVLNNNEIIQKMNVSDDMTNMHKIEKVEEHEIITQMNSSKTDKTSCCQSNAKSVKSDSAKKNCSSKETTIVKSNMTSNTSCIAKEVKSDSAKKTCCSAKK